MAFLRTILQCQPMRMLALLVFMAGCLPSQDPTSRPLGVNCSRKTGIADHVPEYLAGVSGGHPLRGDHRLSLRVVLQLRNLEALNSQIAAFTTAGSSEFGKSLTREQFAERHLPTDEQAQLAVAALRAAGLETDDRPVGPLLRAWGTAQQVERAFGTTIVGGEGRYRPDRQPSMPSEVIRGVQGIGEHLPPRQWADGSSSTPQPALRPGDIRRAYGVPAELSGKGQTLAIVGLDGFEDADLDAYAAKHGIRRVPVRRHLLNGYDGKPRTTGGRLETTMDLQLQNAVAPDADEIWAILASQDDPHGLLDGLNILANPPPGMPAIRHISVSWGTPESGISQASSQIFHTVLKQLAAQSATVFVASGDEGAFDAGTSSRIVDSPASSPFAAAVGGTFLVLGPPRLETTWSGSGGGYSCFWPAPSWQGRAYGVVSHETMRALPDVALAADPNSPYAAIVEGREVTVGGTSAAAPVMAGLAALLAQSRELEHKTPLGFLPPLLYGASCDIPAPGFNDITIGNTHGSQSKGAGIDATRGMDAATGLGSINLAALIAQLACIP